MKHLVLLLSLAALMSCKSESSVGTPKVESISATGITLSNGESINFPSGNDETVLFIVRNGETGVVEDPLTTHLNDAGQLRASKIYQLFKNVPVHSVLAPMSAFANEFGQPTADSHDTKVYAYNAADYGSLLEWIYQPNYAFGQKILVVGYNNSIPDLLNLLTAGQTFPAIPDGVYDDMYVVFTTARGKSKIWHLKY